MNRPSPRGAMSPLQLVLAVALVLAAAATSILLRDGSTAPAPAASEPITVGAPTATPVVTRQLRAPRSSDLVGTAKDPFQPEAGAEDSTRRQGGRQPASGTRSSAGTVIERAPAGGSAASSGGGSTSTSASGGTAAATTPTPTPTATPNARPTARLTAKTYAPTVRFGPIRSPLTTDRLRRLEAVPTMDRPVAQFYGLRANHRTAVFLLAPGAIVSGPGACRPRPQDCRRLFLRPGWTELIAQDGVEFRLELVRVHHRAVTPRAAAAARAATAPGGSMVLEAFRPQQGKLRYDRSRGVVTGGPG